MAGTADIGEPSLTIYINNLNEKVKIPELKQALVAMFSQFGEILDVAARKTLACKGQAWVSFKEQPAAIKALTSMQGFEFHNKPMKIAYAHKTSDIVAKNNGTFIPRPRLPKGERRRRMRNNSLSDDEAMAPPSSLTEPIANQVAAPGPVPPIPPPGTLPPFPTGMPPFALPPGVPPMGPPPNFTPGPPPFGMPPFAYPPGYPPNVANQQQPVADDGQAPAGAPAAPTQAQRDGPTAMESGVHGMPMTSAPPPAAENPPNNILVLTGLPEETNEDMLQTLFSRHPGLLEVRQIPGRWDIAFIEYENDFMASQAKSALQGFKLSPTHTLNIVFAKKS